MIKYPRTPHLPWSHAGKDDRKLLTDKNFYGKFIVVTEKMDGENTTMYRDAIHARSLTYSKHESRNWVKAFWNTIRYNIPEGWRICGENLYATHSIHYDQLRSYFYGFSIWDENNTCLDWPDTIDWFNIIGIEPVPVWYIGRYHKLLIEYIWSEMDQEKHEGYVVRLKNHFRYEDFENSIAKYVRPNHVQTDEHWFYKEIIPNKLKDMK